MAGSKFLTIVCVLRDGTHILHQECDTIPGHAGVRIGAHIALRERQYSGEVERLVIIHSGTVAEHIPGSDA